MDTVNIINLVQKDFTTTYNITGGNTEIVFPTSTKGNLCIEIVAGSFDYPSGTSNGTNLTGTLDGTVDFYQSTDGVNSQQVDGATQLVLDGATKKGGWEEDNFEAAFGHVIIKKNNLTAGTIRILYTFKKI